nr:major facilitator superfamily domain, general substrate transporter [Tanacetum cinerariifolium]
MVLELEEHMNIVENGMDANEKEMVYDSSLDHKGRLPLRSSTGTWKAAFFIIGEPSTSSSDRHLCIQTLVFACKFSL